MLGLLFFSLLMTLGFRESCCNQDLYLPAPRILKVDQQWQSQVLSVTWESKPGIPGLAYDIEVIRTEQNKVVQQDTVLPGLDPNLTIHQWNWNSPFPLECTSHSVRVRSRHQQHTGEWSQLTTVTGKDSTISRSAQMFPRNRVVAVGSSLPFCCIIEEGKKFEGLYNQRSLLNHTQLSRRSYGVVLENLPASDTSGSNVFCLYEDKVLASGAVVFVGYPPDDRDLECETPDLVSVECRWDWGRPTKLFGNDRQTSYSLNGMACPDANKRNNAEPKCLFKVSLDQRVMNWTLTARNPLGVVELTDMADLSHRVHPLAPIMTKVLVGSRNASLWWDWERQLYQAMPLVCQVELTSDETRELRKFTGPGLSWVQLEDLRPYQKYTVRVCCGSQQNFWKWGSWSLGRRFQTKEDRPEPVDAWIQMHFNQTVCVMWKPLSKRDSHGQIEYYEVTLASQAKDSKRVQFSVDEKHSALFSLEDVGTDPVVTVSAKNAAGVSHTSVALPRLPTDRGVNTSEVYGQGSSFDLSWVASANSSCGYVVEWHRSGRRQDCSVEWVKVPEGNTSVRIQSKSFEGGVRFTLSIYACTLGAPELLERREGYSEEQAPTNAVQDLKAVQQKSDVRLSWGAVPFEDQKGFIRGYIVYLNNVSQLIQIGNITDQSIKSYIVRNLPFDTYKFTVKAYTSAGPGVGATFIVRLDPYTDMLIIEILISLAIMAFVLILVTAICYRKRTWVKNTFYPDIPEPKVPEWPRSQGNFGRQTLDVETCSHSAVHIVEKADGDHSREGLEVVVEDPEETADSDSEELASLRYYNQVVREVSQGVSTPDSSGSVASVRTEVTYTGIQTSASSVAAQPQVISLDGYKPQIDQKPSQEPQGNPSNLPLQEEHRGYQSQCKWKLDTPDPDYLGDSLGSPTSIGSSQFLLPDRASEGSVDHSATSSSTTGWFRSLLSGKP